MDIEEAAGILKTRSCKEAEGAWAGGGGERRFSTSFNMEECNSCHRLGGILYKHYICVDTHCYIYFGETHNWKGEKRLKFLQISDLIKSGEFCFRTVPLDC